MYGCESWIIKKPEHQRIDAFELWCRRRLLRVPWSTRRFKQSILKEISPGCSLEGLMLKRKLQCFGHLMRRTNPLEKTLILGKIKGRRRSGQQMMRLLDSISDMWLSLSNMSLSNMSLSNMSWWWTGKVGVLQSMGVAKSWTWLSDWTELKQHYGASLVAQLVKNLLAMQVTLAWFLGQGDLLENK